MHQTAEVKKLLELLKQRANKSSKVPTRAEFIDYCKANNYNISRNDIDDQCGGFLALLALDDMKAMAHKRMVRVL